MYARTKDWDIGEVTVDVDYDRRATPRRFAIEIGLSGDLDEEQVGRLEKLAVACPAQGARNGIRVLGASGPDAVLAAGGDLGDVERRDDAGRPARDRVEHGEMRNAVLGHQLRCMLESVIAPNGEERRDRAVSRAAVVDAGPGAGCDVEIGDEAPELRIHIVLVAIVDHEDRMHSVLGHEASDPAERGLRLAADEALAHRIGDRRGLESC